MSESDEPEVREDAPPEDVVVQPDGGGDVEFHPFEEFDDEYNPRPIQAVQGEDGLPTVPDQTSASDIPVLSKETMVCMADYSKFVIRDRWGAVIAEFEPMDVDRAPNGAWRVLTKVAIEKARRATMPRLPAQDDVWFEVEPLRPECKYYVRQLLHPGSIDGAKKGIMLRACAARRDTSGAMMQLRDSGMLACAVRSPRATSAEIKLDEFDAEKIRQGENREHLSMFESVTSPGGIFGAASVQKEET